MVSGLHDAGNSPRLMFCVDFRRPTGKAALKQLQVYRIHALTKKMDSLNQILEEQQAKLTVSEPIQALVNRCENFPNFQVVLHNVEGQRRIFTDLSAERSKSMYNMEMKIAKILELQNDIVKPMAELIGKELD